MVFGQRSVGLAGPLPLDPIGTDHYQRVRHEGGVVFCPVWMPTGSSGRRTRSQVAKTEVLADYEQVRASLEQGNLAPVYCFYGPERYLLSSLAQAVRKAALPAKAGGFNHDRFSAKKVEPEIVVDSVRTVPMFSGRRLVEVEDVQAWSAAQLAELVGILGRFPDTACLLLTGDNLDRRLKPVKALAKAGVMLKLDRPSAREVAGFAGRQARKLGIRLDPAASAMLQELVGNDLGALVRALDNVALFVSPRKTVAAEDLLAVVPDIREVIIFELTDALGDADLDKAIDALRRLGRERGSGPKILAMVARQVRLLWSARRAMARGTREQALASVLDVHPFVARKLAGQCRNYPEPVLERVHRRLMDGDAAIKRSAADPLVVLERIVVDLCRSAAGRR